MIVRGASGRSATAGSEAAERHAKFCEQHGAVLSGRKLAENVASENQWYTSVVVDAMEFPSAFCDLEQLIPCHAAVQKLQCQDCFWIFWGQNLGSVPMRGRPEHVDDVDAMGTLHWQASGSKKWRLRRARGVPWPATSVPPRDDDVFEVLCDEGSWFLVNTAVFLHQTEIPSSRMSLSYAREFDISEGAAAGHATTAVGGSVRVCRVGSCLPGNVERVYRVCLWCGTATGQSQDGSPRQECACLCCSVKRSAARAFWFALKSRSLISQRFYSRPSRVLPFLCLTALCKPSSPALQRKSTLPKSVSTSADCHASCPVCA